LLLKASFLRLLYDQLVDSFLNGFPAEADAPITESDMGNEPLVYPSIDGY
jgi:hypothetical protein